MLDPLSQTRFDPDLKLAIWRPEGVLDRAMAMDIVRLAGFQEKILDEPFNRFADLSKLSRVHLDFAEIVEFAAERRAASADQPSVKSAFLATTVPAFAIAGMFAALMQPSPIDARVFREIGDAAEWLGVPAEALRSAEQ